MNIRHTLAEALFQRPAPFNRDVFAASAATAFPCRDEFIDFLNERSPENQVSIAKRILLRLNFDHPVFAPNKFFYNLLEFESRVAGATMRQAYYGRDHFIHLVYLYLLGLYLFHYHAPIQKKVLGQFRKMREEETSSARSFGAQLAVDFTRAWQSFVLHHDLCYPYEAVKGDFRTDHIEPFHKAKKFLAKEMSLRLLARLFAVDAVTDEFPLEYFGEVLRRHEVPTSPVAAAARQEVLDFDPGSLDNYLNSARLRLLSAEWKHARQLPAWSGRQFLPLFFEIVGRTNVIATLSVEESGQLLAVVVPAASGTTHTVFYSERYRDSPQEISDLPLPQLAFTAFAPPVMNQPVVWHYYARMPEKVVGTFLEKVCPSTKANEMSEAFNRMTVELVGSMPLQAVLIHDDADWNTFVFGYYYHLLTALNYDEEHDDDSLPDLHEQAKEKALSKFDEKLTQSMAKACELQLRQKLKAHKGDAAWDPRKVPVHKLVPMLLGEWNMEAFADSILQPVARELGREYIRHQKSYLLHQGLKDRFISLLSAVELPVEMAGEEPVAVSTPLRDEPAFDARLKNVAGPTLRQLLDYRPDWASKTKYPAFTDHGVAAAITLMQIGAAHKAPPPDPSGATDLARALHICRFGGASLSASECRYVTNKLAPVAIQAIALHNLYPRHLQKFEKFRTSLHDSPFDFLSMLADTLQDWDRRFLANQGKAAPPQVLSADDFDLRIKGSDILIYQQGGQNVIERSAKLRALLDEYLKNASSLVRVCLSEYRAEPR